MSRNTGRKLTKIGIIGLGDIAKKAYLPVISSNNNIEIVGAMSRTFEKAQEFAREFGFESQLFNDIDAVLAKDPEIVFVHSSTDSHFDIVRHCLENNFPVLIDKPLSENLEEVYELERIAKSKNLLLAVAFNRRYAPLIQIAKRKIKDLESIIVRKDRIEPQTRMAPSTIYDDFIHAIDLYCWLAGGKINLTDCNVDINSDNQLMRVDITLDNSNIKGKISMNRRSEIDLEEMELVNQVDSISVKNLEEINGEKPNLENIDNFGFRRGFTDTISNAIESIDNPAECDIHVSNTLLTHEITDQVAAFAKSKLM